MSESVTWNPAHAGMTAAIYVAHPDYLAELCHELGDVTAIYGNLVLSKTVKPDICFALDVWIDPQFKHFVSITEAAKLLRSAGKYWVLNPLEYVRRSRLIENELRKIPVFNTAFPLTESLPDIGCFSLLDKNTLVYSSRRWKKSPTGYYSFIEDKKNPPNRAYLKLWEALSLCDRYPGKLETAMDLGASPGGWTYVMQSLGTDITAVDKALLDPAIAKLPHVTYWQQSAFAIDPTMLAAPFDWLLCDVACYPERTFELINRWLRANKAKHYIFTIKLQGDTNFDILQRFAAIPNGRVIHLFNNKHEVTFFYPAPAALQLAF